MHFTHCLGAVRSGKQQAKIAPLFDRQYNMIGPVSQPLSIRPEEAGIPDPLFYFIQGNNS
jgi:hypothetical protein